MESSKEGPSAERAGTGSNSASASNEPLSARSPQANISEQAISQPLGTNSQADPRAQAQGPGQGGAEGRADLLRAQAQGPGQGGAEGRADL
ncbi:MAG: hypothetical protein OXP11_23065, partial [Gammaproteobacteria bacterium]|nr:hypothetical protein [Gammaproteobacteria bacterium]